MLEFSTATTGSILRALREVDASIYLLAANPARVSGWHQARMRRALSDLLFRRYFALLPMPRAVGVEQEDEAPALRGAA